MWYINPRINEMLSSEEHDKIVALKSNHAISISWENISIFLRKDAPSFHEDSKILNEMGFFLEPGKENKFIRKKMKND